MMQVAPEEFEELMLAREKNHHLPNRTPSYPATSLSQGTYHIVQVLCNRHFLMFARVDQPHAHYITRFIDN